MPSGRPGQAACEACVLNQSGLSALSGNIIRLRLPTESSGLHPRGIERLKRNGTSCAKSKKPYGKRCRKLWFSYSPSCRFTRSQGSRSRGACARAPHALEMSRKKPSRKNLDAAYRLRESLHRSAAIPAPKAEGTSHRYLSLAQHTGASPNWQVSSLGDIRAPAP